VRADAAGVAVRGLPVVPWARLAGIDTEQHVTLFPPRPALVDGRSHLRLRLRSAGDLPVGAAALRCVAEAGPVALVVPEADLGITSRAAAEALEAWRDRRP
jgi:hypothetical protein